MKRLASTIKEYDYTSREEFEKHKKEMKEKGFSLIENGMFSGALDPKAMDNEKWKFTAFFIKSPFM